MIREWIIIIYELSYMRTYHPDFILKRCRIHSLYTVSLAQNGFYISLCRPAREREIWRGKKRVGERENGGNRERLREWRERERGRTRGRGNEGKWGRERKSGWEEGGEGGGEREREGERGIKREREGERDSKSGSDPDGITLEGTYLCVYTYLLCNTLQQYGDLLMVATWSSWNTP